MTPISLPDPIAAYFAADLKNPEAVARCFTPQATVKDEGHTHEGREAIQAWKAGAAAQYRYTTEPLAHAHANGVHTVSGHVAGNFPGSPVDLQYRFRLDGDLIASLEIGA